MAGAAQLISRLRGRPVPSVPSAKNVREPLEAAPVVAVPPAPPVPSLNHQPQGEIQPEQLTPAVEAASEPPRIMRTAATASPVWLAARDTYLSHVMSCRTCHAPTGRHCLVGAELRATYDTTPMEPTR